MKPIKEGPIPILWPFSLTVPLLLALTCLVLLADRWAVLSLLCICSGLKRQRKCTSPVGFVIWTPQLREGKFIEPSVSCFTFLVISNVFVVSVFWVSVLPCYAMSLLPCHQLHSLHLCFFPQLHSITIHPPHYLVSKSSFSIVSV